jgi:PEP-CTERM motif
MAIEFRKAVIVTNFVLAIFTGLVLVLATANTAKADPILGHVWEGIPNAGDASDSNNRASTLPNAMFTSTGVDYCYLTTGCPNSTYNVTGFLNNPAFTNPQNGFNPSANLNNTEVELTGQIYLNGSAETFGLGHDDGFTLLLSGGPGTTVCSTHSGAFCVDQRGPTAPTITNFTITATIPGLYNFTLDYAEGFGPPALLQWTYPTGAPVGSPVPEPGTLMLVATGLLCLSFGVFVKNRRMRFFHGVGDEGGGPIYPSGSRLCARPQRGTASPKPPPRI